MKVYEEIYSNDFYGKILSVFIIIFFGCIEF